MRPPRRPAILLLAAGLAACAQPLAPVFGEWRGEQPGPSVAIPDTVDLTLEGAQDARTGRYSISTLVPGGGLDIGARERRWGGTWVLEDRLLDGRTLPVIRLLDPLPGDIAAYALLPDRTLHALDPDGRLDRSPAGALYTLSPAPGGAGEPAPRAGLRS